MRTVLLSDAHIDALDDPVQQRLVGFLEALEADRLVLLGDIFHRWWALPGIFPAYLPTVEALRRLVRRGVAVEMVLGNHDFAFHPGLARQLGVTVHERLAFEADGLSVLACHGDQAVGSRRYRAYHRLLRGRPFDLALRVAGPERAWALLGRLAGSPEKTGSCPESLLEAQRAYAREQLALGFELVVLGHSHVPEEHRWAEGAYLNAGSFRDPGSWVEIVDGRAILRDQAP
jgi:UDP-2,3-diacylglucosamine pyrophosphatase LpxH